MSNELIKRLLQGESVEDVINSLFENVSKAHQHLGRLKRALRNMTAMIPKSGVEILIKKDTFTQAKKVKAIAAINILERSKIYWLNFRVRHLAELKTSTDSKRRFLSAINSLSSILELMAEADLDLTVINSAITAYEEAKELEKLV